MSVQAQNWITVFMPVRAFTYICGLYGALIYNQDPRRKFTSYVYISLEWISFLVFFIISFLSSSGPVDINWGNDSSAQNILLMVYTTCLSR